MGWILTRGDPRRAGPAEHDGYPASGVPSRRPEVDSLLCECRFAQRSDRPFISRWTRWESWGAPPAIVDGSDLPYPPSADEMDA